MTRRAPQLGETRRCRNCGEAIILVALIGWTHIAVLVNLECEATP